MCVNNKHCIQINGITNDINCGLKMYEFILWRGYEEAYLNTIETY